LSSVLDRAEDTAVTKLSQKIASYRADLLAVLVCGGLIVYFSSLPVNAHHDGSDYPAHISIAYQLFMTHQFTVPHFLYHIATIAVFKLVPGISFTDAGYWTAYLFYFLLGVILYALVRYTLREANRWLVALISGFVAIALIVVAPINLLTLEQHNLYLGYVAINVYHNPTMVLLKPLGLLLFVAAGMIFEPKLKSNSRNLIYASALLAIISTMAKPNFALCLLPALGLMCAYKLVRKQTVNWQLLIWGFAVPLFFILAAQYVFTFTQGDGEGSAGVGFDPFMVMTKLCSLFGKPVLLLPKFLLSILFPLVVLLLYFKAALRNNKMVLAWLIFLFGAFVTYFLYEKGLRALHGNFTWSGQITLFVLFVSSTLFLLQEEKQRLFDKPFLRKFSYRFGICAVVGLLHVVCGIIWYVVECQFQLGLYW
jgi:hypothetical protein